MYQNQLHTNLVKYITNKTCNIYLQHKSARRHTHTILFITKIAAHYKDNVFPDDEFLHDNINDSAQCITCLTIKPRNIIHINPALGFCDEYPECNITNE